MYIYSKESVCQTDGRSSINTSISMNIFSWCVDQIGQTISVVFPHFARIIVLDSFEVMALVTRSLLRPIELEKDIISVALNT